MGDDTFDADVTGISALRDPVRRRVYRFVVEVAEPVGRDRVAEALGLSRSVAVFHLDRLAADGLLEVEFRRLSGRTGPGAGRPAKLYRRAAREVAVSLPPRHYGLVARMLARAVDRASAGDDAVRTALAEVARAEGRAIGETVLARGDGASTEARRRAVVETLRDHGYEPQVEDAVVVLGNCPFRSLAGEFTELVCGLNLELLRGMADALAGDHVRPELEPREGTCCVRLHLTETEEAS